MISGLVGFTALGAGGFGNVSDEIVVFLGVGSFDGREVAFLLF